MPPANPLTGTRTSAALSDARQRFRTCQWCPPAKRPSPATHMGKLDGNAFMLACEWHVRMWVRDAQSLRKLGAP